MDTILFSQGDFLKKTLVERVIRDFSKVRLDKATVKVPRLKAVRQKQAKPKAESIPISSIVSIMIKNAVEKAKRERKEKTIEEGKSYKIVKDGKELLFNGGYGTVAKGYGSAPHTSYVDYGKLFSYLGSFRAQSGFENFDGQTSTEIINKMMEQDNKFYLVDREVIDNGVRSIKYFTHGQVVGELSAVPMGGINSADWEKFKLWKMVDYVMFNLKMSTL